MKFEDLKLAPALLRAVAEKGYTIATPIQADAIPPILAGRDLVGCAQTGTGKTAAFALPTLERIYESVQRDRAAATAAQPRALPRSASADGNSHHARRNPRPEAGAESGRGKKRKTRALVLAPTRELASQIADSFAAYGRHTPLRHAVVYGGVSQMHQVKSLTHGVDAVIATPGRLLDLMQQGHVDLRHVEILIFDEADQMLDMGFLPDLRRIVARVPRQRQTLMFSATMPEPIRKLADEWLTNPASVSTTPIATPAEKVDQSVYFVQKREKPRLLANMLQRTASERTLVFTRTKHGADKVVKHLQKERIRAAAIHGNKSQGARERVLEQFKSDRPPVLVATDIAARGLHITGISHVVNFDLPEVPETYVHRIGRTARAGASGEAISFCSVDEIGLLRAIERLMRRRIETAADHAEYELSVPTAATVAAESESRRQAPSCGPRRGGKPRPSGRRDDRPYAAAGTSGGKQKSRRPAPPKPPRRPTNGQAPSGESNGLTSKQNGSNASATARPAKRKKRHLTRP